MKLDAAFSPTWQRTDGRAIDGGVIGRTFASASLGDALLARIDANGTQRSPRIVGGATAIARWS